MAAAEAAKVQLAAQRTEQQRVVESLEATHAAELEAAVRDPNLSPNPYPYPHPNPNLRANPNPAASRSYLYLWRVLAMARAYALVGCNT